MREYEYTHKCTYDCETVCEECCKSICVDQLDIELVFIEGLVFHKDCLKGEL